MRLTVAIVFCATLVAAGPQRLDDAHSHGVGAKRHTALVRSLAPLENTIAAHKARFNGNHDLRDVPDGLTYPGDSDNDPSLFGGYADDWIHRLLVRDGESDGTPADNTTVDTSTETGTETGTDTGLGTRASSRKWGIAWTNEITKGLAQLKCDQSIGIYNWGPQTFPDFGKYNCPFIPHLHSERKLDAWKKYVKRYYGKNYMMAPNEVNLASQANLTPERCAWMIRTYMLPLLQKTAGDGGYKLVGPSTANGQSALTWYDKFKKTDAEVWSKIYAVNLHFYGLSADDAIAWIKLWWTRYNKPIWLTEFACHSFTGKGSCNKAQAEAFMKKIIAFCNSTDYCHAYFLYGSYVTSRAGVSSSNAMFNSTNGALSTLGKLYVSS